MVDISVYMLTYFHEKYVAQAIESILSQKTSRIFEIVIADDCSEDGTRDILAKYQKEYPDIIRVILNEKNLGIPRNIFQARTNCRGKYIVGLSGDDYWINDSKLEIEAQFLDDHQEYLAVFNGIELRYDEDNHPYETLPKKKERNIEFTIHDYEKGKVLRSHGFMMRNLFLNEKDRAYFAQAQIISDKVDDAVDMVLLMQRGRVFIIDEVTDAHRVIKNAKGDRHNYNSVYSRVEKSAQYIGLVNNMDAFFNGNEKQIDFSAKYARAVAIAEIDMLFSGHRKEYKRIIKGIPENYRKPFLKSIYVKAIPIMISFGFHRLFVR